MSNVIPRKKELEEILEEKHLTVTFTKADGTERSMRCTRDFSVIPVENHPKGSVTVSTDQIRVWDLEKEAWRSFNHSAITNVEGL